MATRKKTARKPDKTLNLKYYKSGIGSPGKHKLVIKSLGFKRLNQVVTRVDTPAVRGMVAQVPHLVKIIDG